MLHNDLIQFFGTHLQIPLPPDISETELSEKMTAFISLLIQNDFQGLINILYKVDISESRLRKLLQKKSTEDAAIIITKLILERQAEKRNSIKQFNSQGSPSNEERW